MNLTAAFRARLWGRSDSEHEQAILRIVIFAMVLAYMAASFPGDGRGHEELLLLQGLAAALVLALVLLLAISMWPAPNVTRPLPSSCSSPAKLA